MTWTDAQSYCRLKYTDLLYVYYEEDLQKMASLIPPLDRSKAWIGGFDLESDPEPDPQNSTESPQVTQNCLAIKTDTRKLTKMSCTLTFSFFCSQSEYISLHFSKCNGKLDLTISFSLMFLHVCLPVSLGQGKRVVLRLKLNPGGQVDLNDPIIRSNMLAKVKVISSVCSEMLGSHHIKTT